MQNPAVARLARLWFDAGINEGDIVLVHSSIRRTMSMAAQSGNEISPSAILESFLMAVGQAGTLLLPLFNFDFTQGLAFDIRSTPSQMGALTETARSHPAAVRTGHPIYSYAVLGARRNDFRGVNNFSGYGQDSPFGIVHRSGGKIAVLDLPDQNSMTFYHYIEEALNVPYRYHKTFTGTYIGTDGISSVKTYGLFVRDLAKGVHTHVDPMGELLWLQGLYSGSRPGQGSGLRVVDAKRMFDATAAIIRDGRALDTLYRIER